MKAGNVVVVGRQGGRRRERVARDYKRGQSHTSGKAMVHISIIGQIEVVAWLTSNPRGQYIAWQIMSI